MPPPDIATFPRPRDWWMLVGALVVLYLFCLGTRGLNEPDEGRYANIAMAMAQPGGDWWEPRESGFGHYDKPPLIYWTTALGFRTFGFNEWAARLPSTFGAFLALVGLAWAAGRLYGSRVAWWAVLVCGTSVQFWALARVLSPDFLMTGWCTLAIAAWVECRYRQGAWNFWLASLVFWTLAWWSKATPALVPLVGVAVGTWVCGDRPGWRALRLWLLVPMILLLGSPWYLSMMHRHAELRSFFFHRELAGRIVGRVDGRHASLVYYLPVSLIAWLPWWPVASGILWRHHRDTKPRPVWWRIIGVEGWIVLTGLAMFSLANSKLLTYTLVLAPWAALLMARAITPQTGGPVPLARLFPAVVFVVITLAGIAWLPGPREASLGANSSLRPVCQYLRRHGAREVDSDHYWPGMEFYLPDTSVHYVRRISDSQQERASDPGRVPDRFIDPMDWFNQADRPGQSAPASGDRWLVRFQKYRDSPFDPVLTPERAEKVITIGQFDLFHVTLAEGHPAASPAP